VVGPRPLSLSHGTLRQENDLCREADCALRLAPRPTPPDTDMDAVAELVELRDVLVEFRRGFARRGSRPDGPVAGSAARLELVQREIEPSIAPSPTRRRSAPGRRRGTVCRIRPTPTGRRRDSRPARRGSGEDRLAHERLVLCSASKAFRLCGSAPGLSRRHRRRCGDQSDSPALRMPSMTRSRCAR
jgi:hypothetical protein